MNIDIKNTTEYGSKEHYERMLDICAADLETAKVNEDIHLALDVYANAGSLFMNAYNNHREDMEFILAYQKKTMDLRNQADNLVGEIMREEYDLD